MVSPIHGERDDAWLTIDIRTLTAIKRSGFGNFLCVGGGMKVVDGVKLCYRGTDSASARSQYLCTMLVCSRVSLPVHDGPSRRAIVHYPRR